MSQKTKIIIAFSVGIIFLLLVGIFSYRSIRDYKESYKWVSHTQTVINQTQEILSHCQDIETSNRGFAITGKEKYLQPFNQAVSVLHKELTNLKHLTRENKSQQRLIVNLEKEVQKKIDFGKKVNDTAHYKGLLDAQKLILQDTGQIIMNHIRVQVAEIIDNEEALLSEREIKTNNSFEITSSLIIGGSIFAVIVILFSIYVFVRDYNKRLKVEKEIKESEYMLQQFLNALPVGVYILNNKFIPYYANKKAREIMGEGIMLSKEEEMAEVFMAYKKGTDTPFPREESPSFLVLRGAPLISTEDVEIERNGKRTPLRINASPVKDSEGNITYAISVFEDITEQKKAEKELILARQSAEESSLLKEVFLANMSHEIRTPMNAIIGFATLMKETEMTEEQKEFIANISTASENLLGIINDILDISKIESGHIVLEEISFNLQEVVKNVSNIMQHKLKDSKVTLNYRVEANVPQQVVGDPTRLNQILLNLTNNAVKFTEQGEVNILVELLDESATETVIRFNVKDTGIGIPSSKLDSIFERFSQADSNTTRIYGGTGLGLSICKSLVELQGGTISVESTEKVGSNFHFTLTFKKVKQDDQKTLETNNSRKHNPAHRMRLLLVEDNVLNQKLALKVLQNFGFEVDLAKNGKVAVEKVKSKQYDVILMDLQMPEMDGYTATQYIRNELKDKTPIIAMTAHSLVGEKDKCMSIGMNEYIPKPFSPDVLFEKIVGFSKVQEASGAEKNEMSGGLVNLSYLKELSGGSAEFEKEMIEMYLQQTPLELGTLEKAIESADFNSIKTIAHKLKSSFSLIGVNEKGILGWFEKQASLKADTELYDARYSELMDIFKASKVILSKEL